jgi:hypothetical protein
MLVLNTNQSIDMNLIPYWSSCLLHVQWCDNFRYLYQVKSNTLLILRHLSVQENINMKHIHTTDGRQVNLHNVYITNSNPVDL